MNTYERGIVQLSLISSKEWYILTLVSTHKRHKIDVLG